MGGGGIIVFVFAAAIAIALVVFGGPVAAAIIPLLVAGGVMTFLRIYRRREAAQGMSKFREEADTEKTDFTARDRETQV